MANDSGEDAVRHFKRRSYLSKGANSKNPPLATRLPPSYRQFDPWQGSTLGCNSSAAGQEWANSRNLFISSGGCTGLAIIWNS
jgi:hypothetical protein